MSPDLEFELARRHPSFDGSPLIDGGCAHGNGWFDILDRMFSGVEALQPEGIRWIQIKEKCGRLRVYADGCIPEAAALIAAAVAESATICDVCGSPRTHRWDQRAATRCDEHRGPPRRRSLTEEEFAEYEAGMLRILGDNPTKW